MPSTRRRDRGPRRSRQLRIAALTLPRDPGGDASGVLIPASDGRFALASRDAVGPGAGAAPRYAGCDVVAVASERASHAPAVIEALASGCFLVATHLGVAREWIVPGVNGLVVERTPEAFRSAFQWCATHLDDVRRAGRLNARLVAGEGAARDALARGTLPARFAFLTPEYATDRTLGGGLAAYVRSAARALAAEGHEIEVFTTSAAQESAASAEGRAQRGKPSGAQRAEGERRSDRIAERRSDGFDGAAVIHRVPAAISRRWVRALLRICRALRWRRASHALRSAVDAFALARALARRERRRPFDAVQSSDFRATGLFVPGRARCCRPHLVRASNDEAEIAARNGEDAGARAWLDALQRRCLRRADVAYAPSRFLARHYAERYGIRLRVARPPASGLAPPAAAPDIALPKRYFVHFGQLTPVKGSVDLAAALPLVWEEAPDLEMVWVGIDRARRLPGWRAQWGARRAQVHWLGELPRAELHAVVSRADAAVLPSRFDNLPNTVIESLQLGVPVIGTIGASLEELITPGRDGELVPIADPRALASAIVARWRAGPPDRARVRLPDALDPSAAVDQLLALAGLRDGPVVRRLASR